MLRFPVATMVRFCANHGLLQITGRPQWMHRCAAARRSYVDKMLDAIPDARRATPVKTRQAAADRRRRRCRPRAAASGFDAVVFACHSDQALALLADPSDDERSSARRIRWQRNRAVLHTDVGVLPRAHERAWAALELRASARDAAAQTRPRSACIYLDQPACQPLPIKVPVIVSLNPLHEPAAALVQGEFHYAHPVFDRRAIAAQARLPSLQGRADTLVLRRVDRPRLPRRRPRLGPRPSPRRCAAIRQRTPASAASPCGGSR